MNGEFFVDITMMETKNNSKPNVLSLKIEENKMSETQALYEVATTDMPIMQAMDHNKVGVSLFINVAMQCGETHLFNGQYLI